MSAWRAGTLHGTPMQCEGAPDMVEHAVRAVGKEKATPVLLHFEE